MSLADDIAAAYRAGDYGQVQNWINSSGASANDIQSQFGLNSADMSWLTNNVGLNIPGAAPAGATGWDAGQNGAAGIAAGTGSGTGDPAHRQPNMRGITWDGMQGQNTTGTSTTPGWLTGANQWLTSGNTGTSGGSYYDQASNKYIMPVYGQGGFDSSVGDYTSGALTGWNAYDRLPGNNAQDYSNTPFTSFDSTGKQTGGGQFGEIGGTDWIQQAVQLGLMAGGGAVLGNAVGMFGAPGAGSTGAGLGGAEVAAGTAGAGSSGSGLYSLAGGAGAPASGLGLTTSGGGLGLGAGTGTGLGLGTGAGTGLTLGQIASGAGAATGLAGLAGGGGQGLQASIGSGLDLYKQTGGGLGLNIATGDGLNLIKEIGGGLGLQLTPEAIANWTTIGKSLEGLGATEAIKRLTDNGLLTRPSTGTGTSTNSGPVTINNNNGSGTGINDLMGIISGLIGSVGQNRGAGEQRAWLDKQMSDIDKLYAPGSPEYNLLMQEMERKDAAAGRNSQYGPRSTDLAAKIAEIKAKTKAQLAGSTQNSVMSSITSENTSLNSLLAALGKSTAPVTNVSSLLDLFK